MCRERGELMRHEQRLRGRVLKNNTSHRAHRIIFFAARARAGTQAGPSDPPFSRLYMDRVVFVSIGFMLRPRKTLSAQTKNTHWLAAI